MFELALDIDGQSGCVMLRTSALCARARFFEKELVLWGLRGVPVVLYARYQKSDIGGTR